MNPEASAVDEQVDRPTVRGRTNRDLTECLEPPQQRRVVGNGDLCVKHVCQRTQVAFRLSARKVKDHADRQRRLNRKVRVDALATGLPAGYNPPAVDSVVGKPDGEVTSSAEACLVLRPIAYPVWGSCVLVLAPFRILHRWQLQIEALPP